MIHNCECLEFLRSCGEGIKWKTIFADIPDNTGYIYNGFVDRRPLREYKGWVCDLLRESWKRAEIVVLSYASQHDLWLKSFLHTAYSWPYLRTVIWRYRFGQYNNKDLGNGYRPILIMAKRDSDLNFDAIREPSERMLVGDKRANGPRIPDDVWEFPRVTGNSMERRNWHSTQHPEILMIRLLQLCGGPVLDLCLGSGTTAIAASKLEIQWEGCEISLEYCNKLDALFGQDLC